MALAVALIGWSFLSPRIPARLRVALQAGVGGLLVWVTGAPLGLRPPRLWVGLRLGTAAGLAASTAIAAATLAPAVRRAMSVRPVPASKLGWLGWQIPIGTVWAEEAGFRAALTTAGTEAFGVSGARMLQAVAFGLSHTAAARAAGEPTAAIALVTGIAGWWFGWLAHRAGSVAAPMLAHLAVNEAGAVAVLTAQRRQRRR